MKKSLMFGALLSFSVCDQLAANSIAQVIPDAETTVGHVVIYDDAALAFIDDSTLVSVRAEGYTWTEGPVWVDEEDGYLLFSDIPNNFIAKYHPKTGSSVYLRNSGSTNLYPGDYVKGSNGLLLNSNGELVLLQQGDRRIATMNAPLSAPKADYSTLTAKYKGKRLNSPNDAVFHQDGSLFFTDPAYGLQDKLEDKRKELSFQGVYQLTANGELFLLDDEVTYPNGIGLSPDGKILYVAASDKDKPHWYAYDIVGKGKVANKRLFHDGLPAVLKVGVDKGMPDGLAVHSSGVIFATGPEGVWLLNPEGKLLAKVYTGQKTSNCTLTSDEKTLFMTADDYVLSFPLK